MTEPGGGGSTRFRILGPLAVTISGTNVNLGATRQRALLAALLLNRNMTVAKERLVTLLWEQSPPDTARHSIEVYVSGLRRVLGRSRLMGNRAGYVLAVEDEEFDLVHFRRLAEQAAREVEAGELELAEEHFQAALALSRGPALQDLPGYRFAEAESARLHQVQVDVRRQLLEVRSRMGRSRETLAELSALVEENPLSEALVADLMLASFRAGDAHRAITAFYRLRRELVDQLGAEPGEATHRLLRNILNNDVPRDAFAGEETASPVVLPRYRDLFVGRAREVRVVRALADECRLVTLTGLPGVGKTRLAVEAVAGLSDEFPGGAWFVSLLDLEDGGRIHAAIAEVMGLQEQSGLSLADVVVRYLAPKRALLLLDNCESVQPGLEPVLVDLLERCPGLNVLATSLQPLQVVGEREWQVEPLKVPRTDEPADVLASDSAALFRDRAAAADPAFQASEQDAAAISRIVHQLDGLPLAIELTAARLRDTDLAGLAAALGDDIDTTDQGGLRPERHRTLDRALVSTWERLAGDHRRFLEAASLFTGGADPMLVDAVAGGRQSTESARELLVTSLEQRALVRVVRTHPRSRLTMLDSVRRFAHRRLQRRARAQEVAQRYVDVVARMAIDTASKLEGPGQLEAMELLEREYPNIRNCLGLLVAAGDATAALRVTGLLARFWWCRGHITESRSWLQQALHLPGGDAEARAEALRILGYMEWQSGRSSAGREHCRAAFSISTQAGDKASICRSHYYLGIAEYEDGDIPLGIRTLRGAVALARELGDGHLEGLALDMVGRSFSTIGDSDAGLAEVEKALPLLEASGDAFGVAVCLVNNAEANMAMGRWREAWDFYWRAFEAWHQFGSAGGMGFTLLGLAWMAFRRGQAEVAATLVGATEWLWESAGVAANSDDALRMTSIRDHASEELGHQVAEACRARGRQAPGMVNFAEWARNLGARAAASAAEARG